MKKLLLAAIAAFGLWGGVAHACNTPNPNLLGPPFIDGCALPMSAVNKLAPVTNTTSLRSTPTTSYPNGVTRLTDGAVGAPSMSFKAGTAVCSVDDGASCVNSSDGKSWIGLPAANIWDSRQFGNNDAACKAAAVATNGICITTAGVVNLNAGMFEAPAGFFEQTAAPPNAFTSWLNTANVGTKNTYGYLGVNGQLVIATNFGMPAIVGASETKDTPSGNACCAIGITGTAINNNVPNGTTTLLATAWPGYFTGARTHGTGAVQFEIDVANVDSVTTDINPYKLTSQGPPGTSVNLTLSPGGEPATMGSTPLSDTSGVIMIEPNGQYTRHPLVFVAGLFNPTYCTAYCPAIDMAVNYEIRWAYDGSDVAGGFIGSTNATAGTGNGLVFTQFGPFFQNISGGILATIATNASMTNVGYVNLGSTGNDAIINVGVGNGATNPNLHLAGGGTGHVYLDSALTWYAATTGASTPSAMGTSPCTGSSIWKWVAVSILSQGGIWYMPMCQ